MLVALHLNQPALGDGSRQSVRATAGREPTENIARHPAQQSWIDLSGGCQHVDTEIVVLGVCRAAGQEAGAQGYCDSPTPTDTLCANVGSVPPGRG